MFKVWLIYKDGEKVTLEIEKARLQEFYRCLIGKSFYWAEVTGSEDHGFWTDLNDIRFIEVVNQKADGTIEKVSEQSVEQMIDQMEEDENEPEEVEKE